MVSCLVCKTSWGGFVLLEDVYLSKVVDLRSAIEGENVFIYHVFPNIYTYISNYYFQKSLYAYC